MPVVTKRLHILKQTSSFQMQVSVCVTFLLPPDIKATTGLIWRGVFKTLWHICDRIFSFREKATSYVIEAVQNMALVWQSKKLAMSAPERCQVIGVVNFEGTFRSFRALYRKRIVTLWIFPENSSILSLVLLHRKYSSFLYVFMINHD